MRRPVLQGWGVRWCMILAFLVGLPGAVVSGEIVGKVDLMRTSSPQTQSISPYARPRSMEQAEPVPLPAEEAILAVVYLESHPNLKPGPPPAVNPKMNQIEMTIVPHILPVQVGTTVDFPNSDDIYHNLFSLSPARKFDLGRYGKGDSKSEKFTRVGEVRVYCDIHPHMNAVILVLPNAYYAEVYRDGSFRIEGIPAGIYRLHAWHETFNEQIKTVTVPGEGTVSVNFILGGP